MSEKLVVEKSVQLDATPAEVWEALTNPNITKQYFFNCEAISDWKVGSVIEFKTESEGNEVVAVKGFIKDIEPRKRLQYTCFTPQFEDNPEKHTTVTCELSRDGNKTLLSVSQGDFGKDEEAYAHTKTGWDGVLGGLKEVLENRTPS